MCQLHLQDAFVLLLLDARIRGKPGLGLLEVRLELCNVRLQLADDRLGGKALGVPARLDDSHGIGGGGSGCCCCLC